jgi:hypothetical protein
MGPRRITSAEWLPRSFAGILTRRIGPFASRLIVMQSSYISPGGGVLAATTGAYLDIV